MGMQLQLHLPHRAALCAFGQGLTALQGRCILLCERPVEIQPLSDPISAQQHPQLRESEAFNQQHRTAEVAERLL